MKAGNVEPQRLKTTRPTNAIQLYAFGEPDGSIVKLGMSRKSSVRKLQHERRGHATVTMRALAVWWGMPADETRLKNHFAPLVIDGTTEWFRSDDSMRSWLIEMRKQYFVAHTVDEAEIDEMPYVDSSIWLPSSESIVAGAPVGQLSLGLAVSKDDPWADVTIERDQVTEGDFYTPPRILEAARVALGRIDLDPASCRLANKEVKAGRYYSFREDGLMQPWHGRVWLNPPYSGWELWGEKLLHEWAGGNIQAAIVLAATRTTTAKYFHKVIENASALLKMRGRQYFWGPKAGAPDDGHELYYFGENVEAFARAFAPFGRVFVPDHQAIAKIDRDAAQ